MPRFRVAIGGITHETAGVLGGVSLPGGGGGAPTFESFEANAKRGRELTTAATLGSHVSGYLQGCDDYGLESVPLYFASGCTAPSSP